MLRLRNTSPAFGGELEIVETDPHLLELTWRHENSLATLQADLRDHSFAITHSHGGGEAEVVKYSRRPDPLIGQ